MLQQSKSTTADSSTADVRFLLLPLPDFSMLAFGSVLDKLRFSADDADFSQQRYCSWQILGLTAGTVCSSSGVTIEVQTTPQQVDLTAYDYLVVFGSRTAAANLAMVQNYAPLLKTAARQGLTLVAIDNACFLLAAAGLLHGYQVALHWRHVQEFASAFPDIRIRAELLYCLDRKRASCAGGTAAIDLTVELLAGHCGRTRALKGLADMLVDEARGQIHTIKSLAGETVPARPVGRAIALMRNMLSRQVTTEEIALQVGLSRRQLDRLFQQHFQTSAHGYWMEMKLQHLHWRLLNSRHSLTMLADETGIQDISYLCKLIKKRFGLSPALLRKTARTDSNNL